MKVTAAVTLNAGSASGRVVFKVDGKKVATVTLKSGKAAYTLSKRLAVGKHKVTAVFAPATSGVKASTSKTVTITVRKK